MVRLIHALYTFDFIVPFKLQESLTWTFNFSFVIFEKTSENKNHMEFIASIFVHKQERGYWLIANY